MLRTRVPDPGLWMERPYVAFPQMYGAGLHHGAVPPRGSHSVTSSVWGNRVTTPRFTITHGKEGCYPARMILGSNSIMHTALPHVWHRAVGHGPLWCKPPWTLDPGCSETKGNLRLGFVCACLMQLL